MKMSDLVKSKEMSFCAFGNMLQSEFCWENVQMNGNIAAFTNCGFTSLCVRMKYFEIN